MKEHKHVTKNKPESKPGPKSNAKYDLKSLPMPELLAKLGSSPDGLNQAEAQNRLTQYGPNEIEEKKPNSFLKFLTYFWGHIPWMIEGAVIMSGVLRHGLFSCYEAFRFLLHCFQILLKILAIFLVFAILVTSWGKAISYHSFWRQKA